MIDKAKLNTEKCIIVYPNSGEGWDAQAQTWIPRDGSKYKPCRLIVPVDIDKEFKELVKQWIEKGAKIIGRTKKIQSDNVLGGCCRTTPSTIAMIKKEVESMNL